MDQKLEKQLKSIYMEPTEHEHSRDVIDVSFPHGKTNLVTSIMANQDENLQKTIKKPASSNHTTWLGNVANKLSGLKKFFSLNQEADHMIRKLEEQHHQNEQFLTDFKEALKNIPRMPGTNENRKISDTVFKSEIDMRNLPVPYSTADSFEEEKFKSLNGRMHCVEQKMQQLLHQSKSSTAGATNLTLGLPQCAKHEVQLTNSSLQSIVKTEHCDTLKAIDDRKPALESPTHANFALEKQYSIEAALDQLHKENEMIKNEISELTAKKELLKEKALEEKELRDVELLKIEHGCLLELEELEDESFERKVRIATKNEQLKHDREMTQLKIAQANLWACGSM